MVGRSLEALRKGVGAAHRVISRSGAVRHTLRRLRACPPYGLVDNNTTVMQSEYAGTELGGVAQTLL